MVIGICMNKHFKIIALLCMVFLFGEALSTLGGPEPIPNPPTFSITSPSMTVCSGQVSTLPITVVTNGEMQNVQLSVLNSQYVSPIGNLTEVINNILPSKQQIVNFTIFVNTNSSFIPVQISISYFYHTLYSDSEIRNTTLWVKTCKQPISIKFYPKYLVQGRIQNLFLNITNTGTNNLSSISIRPSFPPLEAALVSPQPIVVNSINEGKSAITNASIYVYQNVSQLLPINLNVSFFNGTLFERIPVDLDVLTTGLINFTASSISVSPQNPSEDSIFSVSFILTNTGTSTASAVTVTSFPGNQFTQFGSNSTFIGSIPPDSQTSATLSFFVKNYTEIGNYSIPIKIMYLNNLRQSLNMSIAVPITVVQQMNATALASEHSSGSNIILLLILAFMIIVLVFIIKLEPAKKRVLMKKLNANMNKLLKR